MKSLLPNWSVEVSDFKEVSRVVRKQGSVLLQPLTPEKEGSTKKNKTRHCVVADLHGGWWGGSPNPDKQVLMHLGGRVLSWALSSSR